MTVQTAHCAIQWSCGSDDVERKRGIAPELEIGQRDGWMRTCGVRNKYWKYKYKYKHKHKCKYKYKNKFYKLGRETAGCVTNTENTNTNTNAGSWADWMRTCGVRNKYFQKDW